MNTTADAGVITFTMIVSTFNCGNDTATATVGVNLKPIASLTGDGTNICFGDSVTLTASDATGLVTSYIWYDDIDGDGIFEFITTTTAPLNFISYTPADTVTVMMILQTTNGCLDSAFSTINVAPTPDPVWDEPVYQVGECYPLEVTVSYTPQANVTDWIWNFGTKDPETVDPNDSITIRAPATTGTIIYNLEQGAPYPIIYNVNFQIEFTYGTLKCKRDDNTLIEVCEDFSLPNAFTPNGDGLNDFFVIKGVDVLTGCHFIVFDRWGTKVYENEQYDNMWDGKDKEGNVLKSDTYYYVYTCSKESSWTGWIKLISEKGK